MAIHVCYNLVTLVWWNQSKLNVTLLHGLDDKTVARLFTWADTDMLQSRVLQMSVMGKLIRHTLRDCFFISISFFTSHNQPKLISSTAEILHNLYSSRIAWPLPPSSLYSDPSCSIDRLTLLTPFADLPPLSLNNHDPFHRGLLGKTN